MWSFLCFIRYCAKEIQIKTCSIYKHMKKHKWFDFLVDTFVKLASCLNSNTNTPVLLSLLTWTLIVKFCLHKESSVMTTEIPQVVRIHLREQARGMGASILVNTFT